MLITKIFLDYLQISFFVVAILLSNLMCSSKSKGKTAEKAVQLKIHWQMVVVEDGKGQLMDLIDSVFVIRRNNYFICLVQNETQKVVVTVNRKGDVIRNSVIPDGSRLTAYIFRDYDSLGIQYDSLQGHSGRNFHVDSFLTGKMCKGMDIHNKEKDSLVKSYFQQRKSQLVEVYVPKHKLDENSFDSVYCFYTKESIGTDISFSKFLEQARKMRLYKVVGVYNEIPIGKYPYIIPKRRLQWELKNVPVSYERQIDDLFQRHKKTRFEHE